MKSTWENKISKQGPLLQETWIADNYGKNFEFENAEYLRVKQSVVYWPGTKGKSVKELNIQETEMQFMD